MEEEERLDAKFNMALATLQRLDTLLKEYSRISIQPIYNSETQMIKYKILRQIYLTTIPLLDLDDSKEIKKKIDAIQFKKKTENPDTFIFSAEIDFKMDEILIDLQIVLQNKGKHFMPLAEDETGL